MSKKEDGCHDHQDTDLLRCGVDDKHGTCRSGIGTGTASDSVAQNPAVKSPDAITWGDLAKGHNSFTAAQMMRRLEKAGYRKVRHLRLDGDGLWHADAKMNDQPVHVALDYKGNVAEQ